MADHRIGISLDVRQNQAIRSLQDDFDDVSKSARDIREQFKELDKETGNLVNRGWGSRQQTDELQKQLRLMEQMANLVERRARRSGNDITQRDMQNLGRQIGASYGDVNAVRSISQYQNQPSRSDTIKAAMTFGAKSILASIGLKGGSLLYSGFSNNVQMLPAFANMGKTMAPNGGNMAWAQSMLRSGQGYGYTNPQILAGAQTIQAAAGNTPNFFNQIRGVAQFGRGNGFDYGQAANYFANSYQSGVTGGTGAQMSWQQYAILVAQTVNAGNMQGRNAQVVNALQQMTQIAQQSMVNAPNQNQLGALYATATKSGDQAYINQFPDIMSGINSGIQNPGYGAYGQAAMYQAIAPGANYWHAKVLASEGALGVGDNGKTGFENALVNLTKNKQFGTMGSDQQAVMLGGVLNIPPIQAKKTMDKYFKNGVFDETNFSKDLKSGANPLSSLDKTSNSYIAPGQSAQGFTSNFTGLGGWLYNATLGNPMAQTAAGIIGGGAGFSILRKMGLRFFGGGTSGGAGGLAAAARTTASAGASILGPNGEILSTVGGSGAAAGGGLSLSALAGPAITAGGALAAAAYSPSIIDYIFGHKKGTAMQQPLFSWASNPSEFKRYSDDRSPIWQRLFNSNTSVTPTSNSGASSDSFNASKAAEETAAIIIALRPYLGQINQALGGSSSGTKNTKVSYTPFSSHQSSDASIGEQPISGGNWLSNLAGGSNSSLGEWLAKATGNPYTGSTPTSTVPAPSGTKDFVNKMLPYAQTVSKQTGLPVNFLLAQWGDESRWGTSQLATKFNNFGGIKVPGTNTYESYSSPSAWAQGDADFYTKNSNYKKLLSDARSGASVNQLAADLQSSGYAEDSSYGQNIIKNFLPEVNSALSGMKSSEGAISGSGSSRAVVGSTIKIQGPQKITVQVVDPYKNPIGSGLIPLTTTATMNGQ